MAACNGYGAIAEVPVSQKGEANSFVNTGRLGSYRVSVMRALARCTHRYPPISDGLMPGVSGRLGGAGQRLGVDVLPDLRQFTKDGRMSRSC
jgi:hypothetical protein